MVILLSYAVGKSTPTNMFHLQRFIKKRKTLTNCKMQVSNNFKNVSTEMDKELHNSKEKLDA